jgi:WD40 repeat protein/serine/threonine protein kinase
MPSDRDLRTNAPPPKTPDPYATVAPATETPAPKSADPLETVPHPSGAQAPASSRDATAPGPSRYHILRLHARGGLGQVSIALDEELRREVALKEIQSPFADDPDSRARFVREAEITGSLEHPGIVPIYGLGVSCDGRPYYAMRFIHGRSLLEAVDEFHRNEQTNAADRTMKFRELLRRFIDTCNAVEYAHSRGVLHRDLKPANVMIGQYGETLVVDWGLAKAMGESDDALSIHNRDEASDGPRESGTKSNAPALSGGSGVETVHGSALGTPAYMSPEQSTGDWATVAAPSDVYSLGASLYHIVTGSAPLEGFDVREILDRVQRGDFLRPRAKKPSVPAPLEAICLRAMALRPADRYASARELAADVERFLADEHVSSYRERFHERWFRRMRRHRAWTMAVATVLPVLLVVMTVAAIWVETARREALRQKDLSDKAKDAEAAQKRIAETNATLARQQEAKAVAATDEARRSLVSLLLASGERAQSEGDISAAMLWYAKALPLFSTSDARSVRLHRQRIGLLLRQLARPATAWTLPDENRRRVVRQFLSPDGRQALFVGRTVVGVDADSGRELWPPLPYAENDLIPWVGYSPDGTRIIALAQPRSIRLWDATTGKPLSDTLETANNIPIAGSGSDGKAELSRDNRWLVVTTQLPKGRAVEVWDVAAGKRAFEPLEFPSELGAASISPDSTLLMVASESSAKFYKLNDGSPAGGDLPVPGLWHAAYSPDGRWIATSNGEGTAQLWDTASREAVGPALTHRGPVTRVVFSPDSKHLLTLCADRTARLWDVATGKALGGTLDHNDRPFTGAFSTDGRRVTITTLNHTVHLWDVATGRQLTAPWRHTSEPTVSATDDRVRIVVDGRGATWDVIRTAEMSDLALRGLTGVQHLAYTPDGATLITAAGDRAWMLDSTTGALKSGPILHDAAIHSVAISPDGLWLATAGADGTAQLWSTVDGKPQGPRLTHSAAIVHAVFDARSDRLLTCSEDHTARIWQVSTGEQVGAALEHKAAVRFGDFSPDGRVVITAGDDGLARVWNAADGQPLPGNHTHIQLTPPQPFYQARFNPREDAVLAAGRNGKVYVWNPFDAKTKLSTFSLEGAGVTHAEFSPDGRLLLAAGLGNIIRVWRWRDADRPPASMSVSTAAFHAHFDPTSSLVAASSFDGVQLWEADTGRPIGTRLGPLANALTFCPDGSGLTTADEQLRFWSLTPDAHAPEELLQLVTLCAQRELDDRGTLQYLSAERIESLQREMLAKDPADFTAHPGRVVTFAEP